MDEYPESPQPPSPSVRSPSAGFPSAARTVIRPLKSVLLMRGGVALGASSGPDLG